MKPVSSSLLVRIAAGIIIAAGIVLLLIFSKHILLPIVVAFMLAYIVTSLSDSFAGKMFLGKKIPHWLAYIISAVVIGLIFWGVITMITHHLSLIVNKLPFYQAQLVVVLQKIGGLFGADAATQVTQGLARLNLVGLLGKALANLATIGGKIILVVIYTIFMILEFPFMKKKIRHLFRGHDDEKEQTKKILARVSRGTKTYFRIKSFASLLTAALCLVVLLIFKVDFPFFWALIIFLLNFIPTIGSIIAVIFPSLLALVQFGSIGKFAAVIILLIGMQLLVGNFIEPRIAGKQLNISPLAILIGLVVAGAIWGVIGMIISVPLIIVLKIIASEFPRLRPFTMLLSRDIEE